jgi:predicted nucleic acid-binding protein
MIFRAVVSGSIKARCPTLILVDTSIWIDHFRSSSNRLVLLLDADMVCMHSLVVGELACGNLADRANTIYLLKSLPRAAVASDDEVLFFIDQHRVAGKGLGYLDMHLLAAAALASLKVWTRDRRLGEVSTSLGLNA